MEAQEKDAPNGARRGLIRMPPPLSALRRLDGARCFARCGLPGVSPASRHYPGLISVDPFRVEG